MKKLLPLVGLVLYMLAISCTAIDSGKQEAIEVVQNAKYEQAAFLLNIESITNLELANRIAQAAPNHKYEWHARDTDEKGSYLVSFTNPEKGGHYWFVNNDQKVVQYVNKNDYLSRKYDLSGMITKNMFLNDKLFFEDTLIISNEFWGDFSSRHDQGIVYIMHGNIVNNTGKTLTKAALTTYFKLIYKDKTIQEASNS